MTAPCAHDFTPWTCVWADADDAFVREDPRKGYWTRRCVRCGAVERQTRGLE